MLIVIFIINGGIMGSKGECFIIGRLGSVCILKTQMNMLKLLYNYQMNKLTKLGSTNAKIFVLNKVIAQPSAISKSRHYVEFTVTKRVK